LDRKKLIHECIKQRGSETQLAMRLLVLSPTHAFEGREEVGFSIIEEAARFFDVSVRAVHACGSAKLGFSPVKGSEFVIAESDLDLAIIDGHCFNRYLGQVIEATNQYRDLTGFRRGPSGDSPYNSFVKYLAKGIFRPDFMPMCRARSEWFSFLQDLSKKHSSVFGKISAGLYLSDQAFQLRQSEALAEFGKKGAHL
jgi:hypothetical protein